MKIRFVIFDMTGTLIEQHSIMESIDEEFNIPFLKDKGFDIKPDEFKKAKEETDRKMEQENYRKNKGVYGMDLWTNIICQRLGILYSKKLSDEWGAEFRKYIYSKMKLMEGAKEILEYLKTKGYKLALFTNSTKENAKIRLGKFGLEKYFDFVFVSEEIGAKSSVQPFKTILEKTGAKAEECVMVGNRMDEDAFAKNVGMKTVLLEDSRQKYYKAVATKEPDFMIRKLEELKNIL